MILTQKRKVQTAVIKYCKFSKERNFAKWTDEIHPMI